MYIQQCTLMRAALIMVLAVFLAFAIIFGDVVSSISSQ